MHIIELELNNCQNKWRGQQRNDMHKIYRKNKLKLPLTAVWFYVAVCFLRSDEVSCAAGCKETETETWPLHLRLVGRVMISKMLRGWNSHSWLADSRRTSRPDGAADGRVGGLVYVWWNYIFHAQSNGTTLLCKTNEDLVYTLGTGNQKFSGEWVTAMSIHVYWTTQVFLFMHLSGNQFSWMLSWNTIIHSHN